MRHWQAAPGRAENPEGIIALSIDAALSSAKQMVQVSLDNAEKDVRTAANASNEISPPWHLDQMLHKRAR